MKYNFNKIPIRFWNTDPPEVLAPGIHYYYNPRAAMPREEIDQLESELLSEILVVLTTSFDETLHPAGMKRGRLNSEVIVSSLISISRAKEDWLIGLGVNPIMLRPGFGFTAPVVWGARFIDLQGNERSMIEMIFTSHEPPKINPFFHDLALHFNAVISAEPVDEIPIIDNPSGMYCPLCRSQGVSHCSEPDRCSGMVPMKKLNIKSRFICLEGTDFTGKTSVIATMSQMLTNAGIEHIITREPGGCSLAEKLRGIILSNDSEICPLTELLMFMAARNEHLHTVIFPALEAGKVVLCDRFVGSSYIYQGINKSLGAALVLKVFNILKEDSLIRWILDEHLQTFLLDVDFEVAKERHAGSGRGLDRMDCLEVCAFNSARKAYQKLPEFDSVFSKNFHLIDASGSVNSIAKTILTKAGIQ